MSAKPFQKVLFRDLGLIDYKQAWDLQEEIFSEIVNSKIANRNLPPEDQKHFPHQLLFCEHPHVYTLGKSGHEDNLLKNAEELKEIHATYYKINRGGDITYHGPGQIVGYPIFDLDHFFTDIHKYLRYLEEAIILTLADYGIVGGRYPEYTGVWLDADDDDKARKICAMGVRCSRWVTMHGFAFNVNTDLTYFGNIIPCGIDDKAVTTMQAELNRELDMQEVEQKLLDHLATIFEFQPYTL
jgi:lipoyl(octanoyl) transferase